MELIRKFIKRHQKKYPLMDNQDIYKMIYQSSYLSGHLVSEKSYNYLLKEVEEIKKDQVNIEEDLYEYIDIDVVRVNLRKYINNFSLEELFDYFLKSSLKNRCKNYDSLLSEYKTVNFLDNPHHSDIYRVNYFPNYRILHTDYLPLELRVNKLMQFLDNKKKLINRKRPLVVCLEGKCCSGKTTIANSLEDVTIIRCDDHFKNPIDLYDMGKILKDLEVGQVLEEKCYDCSRDEYYTKVKKVLDIVIVEGVYGYSEPLRKYYDYLCFACVSSAQQLERLKIRENGEKLEKFLGRWIPREKIYFSKYDFIEKADILI